MRVLPYCSGARLLWVYCCAGVVPVLAGCASGSNWCGCANGIRLVPSLAGCEDLLRCKVVQGSQWGMFPGIRSLGGRFQNRTCQCWVQPGRMSEQKWLLLASVSSCVPVVSSLGGTSKFLSGSLSPMVCALSIWYLYTGFWVEWVYMNLLKNGLPFPCSSNLLGHTPLWFS